MQEFGDITVAVPAKNEAAHIGDCLTALALQQGVRPNRIVLLLNNCTDETLSVVEAARPALPVQVDVVSRDLPSALVSAGYARHLAMEHAAATMQGGVLLTTDGDGRAAPDWIASNLAALRDADVVAGRAVLDAEDALRIPQRLHDDDALECAYGDLLDEIASLLDPDPADPWPRHTEHSGASIAVWLKIYRAAGGMPAIPLGEDREFFRVLRRADARVRHAPAVTVTVSGRILGRAAGGMADTIRRRLARPDPFLDDRLEPPESAVLRARLRGALRAIWQTGERGAPHGEIAAALGISAGALTSCLASRFFGAAWEEIETISPSLLRQLVPADAVCRAIARATTIRDALRARSEDEAVLPA